MDLNWVMPARACEWSRSGRISALRSDLFLWVPLHLALSDLPILLCCHCSQFCSQPLTTPLPLTRLLARSTRILLQCFKQQTEKKWTDFHSTSCIGLSVFISLASITNLHIRITSLEVGNRLHHWRLVRNSGLSQLTAGSSRGGPVQGSFRRSNEGGYRGRHDTPWR